MSPRVRILAVVSVAAAAAVAIAVGATLLQSDPPAGPAPPSGEPPLVLDLGARDDAEARDLRRAEQLYDDGDEEGAAAIFARYRSLNARVGLALARWPDGTVERLEQLAAEEPDSGLVRLNLGFALFWAGREEEAVEEWRAVRRLDPDSLAAVRAGDLLFPSFARGLPIFVPGRIEGEVGRRLLAGVRFQQLGRPLSARREYDAAARLAPGDPAALTAAAVARFDKANPSAAFARLGPLAQRFPRAPTVRFHLGLMLLWLGRVDEAKDQLARAGRLDPADPLAREANRFLARLESIENG
ncbi:MAG: tetratricopeptide repeat protein [Gaiellaceae bacterium]